MTEINKIMHLLFSYGTLQQLDVQYATFGRKLEGSADHLIGFKQEMLKIKDPAVVELSGKTHHPIVIKTDNVQDSVAGSVYEITEEELLHADEYEVSDYKRVLALLSSGNKAWVYVAIDDVI